MLNEHLKILEEKYIDLLLKRCVNKEWYYES